jgi:hypothetical protein
MRFCEISRRVSNIPVILWLRCYDMWGLQWKLGRTRNVRSTGCNHLQASWISFYNYQISLLPDMLNSNKWRWERTGSIDILNCNEWRRLLSCASYIALVPHKKCARHRAYAFAGILNALLQLPNKHATGYTKLLNEEGCSWGSVHEE